MTMVCSTKKEIKPFQCTGSDESHIWKMFHDKDGHVGPLMDKFNCGTCQKHGHDLFLGLHSMVSLGIGKNLQKESWKKNFSKFRNEVNRVYDHAKKDGRLS